MIKFNNYAELTERRGANQYYRWKVFVDADAATLANIDRVEYQLHPTFPDPIRSSDDPENRFAIETSGWGEFSILAEVRFKDGHTETVSYWLDLSKGWPETPDDST
jgi:transcription initiation factor IIF auxiliary subunit